MGMQVAEESLAGKALIDERVQYAAAIDRAATSAS